MGFRTLIRRCVFLVAMCLVFVSALPLHAVDPTRQLSPYFRHWLDEEVPCIISSDERHSFLALHSDLERERFIQAFWEARNPTPGSGENSYKEEYYRRLTYASEHFGSRRYQDGWRTERGRIYVTLGPPNSIQTYHLTANIRDLEIWFYKSPSPALPNFFNVLFFRPGAGEDYKIYSPRSDGPYRLVTTGQQNNKAAMHVIQQQLGPELAHASLSLIPSEPVDLDSGEPPSMTSDLMLGTILDLADSPLEKQRVEEARVREKATSSVLVPGGARDLQSMVVLDARGRCTLSYFLRDHSPNPALIGKRQDGKDGYSLQLRTSLSTANGKLIYEQNNTVEGVLTGPQINAARTRDFAVEDRLPVLPGDYRVEISVRNNLTGLASLFNDRVVVPAIGPQELGVSALLTYAGPAVRDSSSALPFSLSGIRFPPRGISTTTIHVGDRLPLVFQLHLPTMATGIPRPATVHLHYLFGSLAGSGGSPTELDEDVKTDSADADGNIVTGRTLDTFDLPAGTYRVVVRATGAAPMLPGSSALQLRVVPATLPIAVWTAYGAEPQETIAQDDLKRGLVAAAQGHPDQADTWFRANLREHPDQTRSFALLAATLAATQQTQQLAALGSEPQLKHATDPQTVITIALAMQASGESSEARALLQAQCALQPPNPEMLDALAQLFRQSGDLARAEEYRLRAAAEKKGKGLGSR